MYLLTLQFAFAQQTFLTVVWKKLHTELQEFFLDQVLLNTMEQTLMSPQSHQAHVQSEQH
jgi:hypothetical protein